MNREKIGRGLPVMIVATALTLLAVRSASTATVAAPSPPAQSFSYSITRDSPSSALGLHPADIVGVGGVLLIACPELGLTCTDPSNGTLDDITALSFGQDFDGNGAPPIVFSVDSNAQGKTNTAVRGEATCQPAEARADAFQSTLTGANEQELDGDGVACANNGGFALALTESAPSDNVDALAHDPCTTVDTNCDGIPEGPVFLALAPQSPTLAEIGATSADILVAAPGVNPEIWLTSAAIGLRSDDVIDGLCLQTEADSPTGASRVIFSLAPGSPSLTAAGAGPGDLLRAPLRLAIHADAVGLAATDNVDGLLCGSDLRFSDLYLPVISRQ
ncbi:MAG: hypothetical protein KAX65_01905 [Caldilineaceae bacterium]|nr:hypothetical protein [Caldilineaceae bacterium]